MKKDHAPPLADMRRRRALLLGMALAPALRARAGPPARRVVVLGGSIAEIVYALGDPAASLLGVDSSCTYPAAVRRLPSVGYQRALSIEGLLSLRPDLVLASADAGPPDVLRRASAAGVTVRRMPDGHSPEAVLARIAAVAEAMQAPATGAVLAARFRTAWHETQARIAARRGERAGPRVVFVMNHNGNQALGAGRRTAADAVLSYAGGRNALAGFDGYRPLTPEALAGAAPDAIVTTDETLRAIGGRDALLRQPGFALTRAGRGRHVLAFDALFLLGFGPRLPAAVAALAYPLMRIGAHA